jgi:hypothetical protein
MDIRVGRILWVLVLMSLVGCVGLQKSCASSCASSMGADWVVVQFDLTGRPFLCWELPATSVSNEEQSDGIFWQDTSTGNLVHISGMYNSVQVMGGKWDEALASIGLTREECRGLTRLFEEVEYLEDVEDIERKAKGQ